MAVTRERTDVTMQLATFGSPSVRDGRRPSRVVSVLFASGVDEWRRGWSAHGGTPEREAVVSASDTTRSAAATGPGTQVFPDRQLAYTLLGRPADPADVIAVVADYLAGAEGTAPTVFVDDLAPVVSNIGVSAATDLIDMLSRAVRGVGGSAIVGCSVTPSTATAVGRSLDLVDEVGGIETDAIAAVERLHRRDPTTFGYTRRYWEDARDGIDACDRNYPQSKQVHAALETTDTTPRTLGATLSGLVELGVLGTWGKTVGSTRYDLTAYDPVRLASIGVAFALVTDQVGYRRGSSS